MHMGNLVKYKTHQEGEEVVVERHQAEVLGILLRHSPAPWAEQAKQVLLGVALLLHLISKTLIR